jgi:integrase
LGTRQVGPADVRAYVATRLEEGASSGTINRELAALRRAYTLGVDGQKIQRAPKIKALDENNVRTGFFEREQLEAVRRHLREPLRPVVTFAYITGWRVPSEVLPLTWRQVDSKAGTIRLEPGTTKNDEARMFVMTPELRSVLEAHRNATETLQRKTGRIIPNVFHRRGKPIRDFRGAWSKACEAAGIPGRIPHDFRRTTVRNLERAGVPRSVAMKMVGHKTEAVYRRYAIVMRIRPPRSCAQARGVARGHVSGHVGGCCRVVASRKHAIILPRESGETGRRAGLRIQWAKALGGSTPPSRTK